MYPNNKVPGQPDLLHMFVDLTTPVTAVKYENGFYCIEHGEWSEVVSKERWLSALTQLEHDEEQERLQYGTPYENN